MKLYKDVVPMGSYTRTLNAALRAEADLESAMLHITTMRWKLHEANKKIGMQTAAIDKAHTLMDKVPFIQPRAVSHLGLSSRIDQMIKRFNSRVEYSLKDMSTESLNIIRLSYIRHGCEFDAELLAELQRRGIA